MIGKLIRVMENQQRFTKLPFVLIVFPILLAQFSLFLSPILEAGIVLLIIQNAKFVYNKIKYDPRAPVYVRLYSYGMIYLYLFGIYIILKVIILSIDLSFNSYQIGIVYFLIYVIWVYKKLTQMDSVNRILILKFHTNCNNPRFHLSTNNFVIPIIIILIYTILRTLFQSILDTSGKFPYTATTLVYILIFFIGLLHLLINGYIESQIYWIPKKGVTEWRQPKSLPPFPALNDPKGLANYFYIAMRLSSPPEGIFELLEDDLELLVKNCENINYLPFVTNLVYAMSNWGDTVRYKTHLLHLLVLSQISKYRIFGLIPVYKRRMVYDYLGLIAKLSLMSPDWLKIISFEFEQNHMKDQSLAWMFVDASSVQSKYIASWYSIWDNNIYKGPVGFQKMREKYNHTKFNPLELSPWEEDCWEVALEYIQLFFGSESRKVLSGDLALHTKLHHLSKGRLLSTFKLHKESSHVDPLYVEPAPQSSKKRNLTDIQKAKIIDQTLFQAPMDQSKFNLKSELQALKDMIKQMMHSIRSISFVSIIQFVLLISLNLFILWLINKSNLQLFNLITFIELLILVFISIIPSTEQDASLFSMMEAVQKNPYSTFSIKSTSRGKYVAVTIIIAIYYAFLTGYF